MLGAQDLVALRELVAADPVINCVVDGQLAGAQSVTPREVGGTIWGVDDPSTGSLRAAAFVGGNLIPVGSDAEALTDLATEIRRSPRRCSSVVGTASAVATMWPVLSKSWGTARAIRHRQPLLVTDRCAHGVHPDLRVRLARPTDIADYEHAAVQMFAEELGVLPSTVDGGAAYRRRLLELIRAGRAFARFDARGRVEFKAEFGALSSTTAQIQGVWVRPDLRQLGIATAAMASVIEYGLSLAPRVSLYVNDYNHPARKLYGRVGFGQLDTFTTILF